MGPRPHRAVQVHRAGTDEVLERLAEIKHANKVDFAAWVKAREGVEIDPDAIFDVQIKRLHEYKRQLLNAFYVLDLYFRMKDDPTLDTPNRVFIFGAKAAPGYIRAKAIIKLINAIGELVNNDKDINGRIKVVFVHNYNVSPAEHIIPAADVSEQISMAGKEASGTSNMKFMMNGALTLGTLDGANVEILEAVGADNAYIFGATDDELPELRRHYDPRWHYENVPGLKRVIDALTDGNAPTTPTPAGSTTSATRSSRAATIRPTCTTSWATSPPTVRPRIVWPPIIATRRPGTLACGRTSPALAASPRTARSPTTLARSGTSRVSRSPDAFA